jgi:diguanylate cyclase (GGDEF)-like protein/PAS domain S-box-containing protein
MNRPMLARLLSWARASIRPYHVDESFAGHFRARQLQAVLRLTPLMMAANAVNGILILTTFWSLVNRVFLLAWYGVLLVIVTRATLIWRRGRHRSPGLPTSARALRRAAVNATVLAAVWAIVPIVLFHVSDGPRQLFIATMITGMMCAGGFALATTPLAGTLYVVTMGASASVAVFRADFPLALPLATLLIIYSLVVMAVVWTTARMFGARLMAEAAAERHNEVIGLLLRDFEEHASDVLWEIDAAGYFCHASSRLSSLFGVAPEQLASAPALDLVAAIVEKDNLHQLATLRMRLDEATPFSHLPLALTREGHTRWWSLTAKPLFDASGRRTGWRGVAADVTDAQRANRQLTWLAHFDTLTGLANRYQFRSDLAALLRPERGPARPFAVLCLDLDHFKTINDTLGHAIGNGVLQEVARRLLGRTRRSDTVARLGGDEFAVILRDVESQNEAGLLTHRLLGGLESPCDVQGTRILVRSSVGVALAPRDGSDIDALLNHADRALYAAKSAGREEYRFFASQMGAQTRRRLSIEHALRGASARRELSLVFQPIVNLSEWRILGFEALLRWRQADLGQVPPSEFIPVAEEAGLIDEIGEWVLTEACRQATGWRDDLTISVNVSPVQAMSEHLAEATLAALRATGLPAERLELEITESVFLRDVPTTVEVLRRLHAAGVRVALDDFGTGYSSLAYLRRFPFDTLKIDHTFVHELMDRHDAQAIVRMIVELARVLHMRIVAEGVESTAQAHTLRQYGCDALQGMAVAKPMAAEDVAAFLAAWPSMPRLLEETVHSRGPLAP